MVRCESQKWQAAKFTLLPRRTSFEKEILECCDPVAFAIGLVEHEDYLAELENE